MKNLIINADDFGYSQENNEAIKLGYKTGIITSASLMANMKGFEHAKEIIKDCPELDIGFHFNIIEGKSLSSVPLLTDSNSKFNNSFIKLLVKSQKKEVINQIEKEYRTQLEKVLTVCRITHIDSHLHIHSIPAIFNLTLKLAKEYNIKYVRTQHEIPYIVWNKILNKRFPANILKNILLNTLTSFNIKNPVIKNSEIITNTNTLGILYTGYMDKNSILFGLDKIRQENPITEVIIHPYFSTSIPPEKINNYKEFQITQIKNFKEETEKKGFTLSKHNAF